MDGCGPRNFGKGVKVDPVRRKKSAKPACLADGFFVLTFNLLSVCPVPCSVHPALVILVGEPAQDFQSSVFMHHGYGRVVHSVEHVGLDRGVVNHVFEYNLLSHVQGLLKAPVAYEVAAQAAVAPQPVGVLARWGVAFLCPPHVGLVGHFQAVGHVARKAGVEHGRAYAVVFHNVQDLGGQVSCAPEERRSWLKDDLQVGKLAMPFLQQVNEQANVVSLARHQVSAAHVEPLGLLKPGAEFLFHLHENLLQRGGVVFAQAVEVQAVQSGRQFGGELALEYAQARTWGARVVQVGLYLGILGVDSQPHAYLIGMVGIPLRYARAEAMELAERVESDVLAVFQDVVKGLFLIGRRVGVASAAEGLGTDACLVERTGRGVANVFAEDGKGFPKREGLEGKDDFCPALPLYVRNEAQVLP